MKIQEFFKKYAIEGIRCRYLNERAGGLNKNFFSTPILEGESAAKPVHNSIYAVC